MPSERARPVRGLTRHTRTNAKMVADAYDSHNDHDGLVAVSHIKTAEVQMPAHLHLKASLPGEFFQQGSPARTNIKQQTAGLGKVGRDNDKSSSDLVSRRP